MLQYRNLLCAFFAAMLPLSCAAAVAVNWSISRAIPLSTSITRIRSDGSRAWVYAIDRQNSDLLFINLQTAAVEKRLYVGKDPSDFDIDASGEFLYIANKGPGTGLPGSWRIGVVALTNQTLVTSYITTAVAENVVSGRPGRVYYNSGMLNWNGGDAHALNTDLGVDLGSFAVVKSRMVISSDKTRLFGQYTYDGNLGAMGAFDVSSDPIALRDRAYYSPYPYGWDYDNYSISADNRCLAYGQILFNSTNFSDQIGWFPEQVCALNLDGTVAFGQISIWDTTTFALHGDATRIAGMPFTTTIMTFDNRSNLLYAFNPLDYSLCTIEQTTAQGIPLRWLSQHGLATTDNAGLEDPDGDGYTNAQEWLLDSDPNTATGAFSLRWNSRSELGLQSTSLSRLYLLQRTTNPGSGNWFTVSKRQGTGGSLSFDISADQGDFPAAFYRVRPALH